MQIYGFFRKMQITSLFLYMLLEFDNKIISTELFQQKFVCDLSKCKGACCIEGDAGAPLKENEIVEIENNLSGIKKYMRPEGINAINEIGVYYRDDEDEPVTTLVNGNECAFVYFDDQNIAKCAIEQAYKNGDSTFYKPISCHLYPIRVKKFGDMQALNYDEWSICEPACSLGETLKVPVYKFLKEPIIRAFGEDFFNELAKIENEM